jgi:hypothetical protein
VSVCVERFDGEPGDGIASQSRVFAESTSGTAQCAVTYGYQAARGGWTR